MAIMTAHTKNNPSMDVQDWIDVDLTLAPGPYAELIDSAVQLKALSWSEKDKLLANKAVYFIFFNQSTRTRSSFLTGLQKMGGIAIALDPGSGIYTPALPGQEIPYATERVSDVARVLSGFGDAIAIRMYGEPAGWVYGQANRYMKEFADWAGIPVISMECGRFHPCQALADMMTIKERLGGLRKKRIVISWAYSGSWHKPVAVPQSLLLASTKCAMDVVVAHPPGFELDEQVMAAAEQYAAEQGGSLIVSHDLEEAVRGADIVYAKSWCSLGHLPRRLGEPVNEAAMVDLFEANRHWMVDERIMQCAGSSASYLHCFPADRGQEVSDKVMDGPQSLVFQQAANRMHAQNAIMARVLSPVSRTR